MSRYTISVLVSLWVVECVLISKVHLGNGTRFEATVAVMAAPMCFSIQSSDVEGSL